MKNWMKLCVPLLIASMLLVFTTNVVAQDKQADQQKIEAKADKPIEVAGTRITRAQKRSLGILPRQILVRAKQLAKDGDITQDMSTREMALIYAAEVSTDAEYAGAWKASRNGEVGAPTLDEILEFIERVLELLAKFLPLFI